MGAALWSGTMTETSTKPMRTITRNDYVPESFWEVLYATFATQTTWTATQKKQVTYLEKQNEKEIRYGMWSTHYECSCRTCGTSKRFGAADNARKWLEYWHVGHATWIDTVRG